MNISTSTFQRILESGHYKTIDALTGGEEIKNIKEVMDMSGFDQKGPNGEGPATGRGDGGCTTEKPNPNPRPRVGQGQGLNRGNRRNAPQRVGRGRANKA